MYFYFSILTTWNSLRNRGDSSFTNKVFANEWPMSGVPHLTQIITVQTEGESVLVPVYQWQITQIQTIGLLYCTIIQFIGFLIDWGRSSPFFTFPLQCKQFSDCILDKYTASILVQDVFSWVSIDNHSSDWRRLRVSVLVPVYQWQITQIQTPNDGIKVKINN